MAADDSKKRRSWPPPDAADERVEMLFGGGCESSSSSSSSGSGSAAGTAVATRTSAAAVAVCFSLLLAASHVTVFYVGLHQVDVPASCAEAELSPRGAESVATARPGGWIVIQRRGNFGLPADFFNRNYKSYLEGFGDPSTEFWLGLKDVRILTKSAPWELLVRLGSGGDVFEARYDRFQIGPEPDFALILGSEFKGNSSSGAAVADGLGWMNGSAFSAPDRDRDAHLSVNCAQDRSAGYW